MKRNGEALQYAHNLKNDREINTNSKYVSLESLGPNNSGVNRDLIQHKIQEANTEAKEKARDHDELSDKKAKFGL